ncbi:SRPBCC domain-containing protein [uncultured Martelella sp.]|uniref:SRPBCC domain-containing protein n=1 Tax=uncultured Martelella sp. TaxID=392331 RepID=UPI0029C843FD|nr:SRPBCC domain-containing protein [uncultured Martelella sp.]
MELKFRVSTHVSKPVEEVFDAVVDPKKLSGYFTTGGASERIAPGATVIWSFHDFPGACPVRVREVEENRKIVLNWEASENGKDAGYDTTVTMTFSPIDDNARTLVTITEEGWRETEGGLKASYINCAGWEQMLCALRVYIEHGINLRDGMYK